MPDNINPENAKKAAEEVKKIETSTRETNKQSTEFISNLNTVIDLSRGITQELQDSAGIRTRIAAQDREIVNLSRAVTEAARESNRELRRSGKLLSQIQKERSIAAKIETESINLQANLTDSQREQLSILTAIARSRGVDNELYTRALRNIEDGTREELDKIVLLRSQQKNLGAIGKLRERELKVQGEVNKNLGIAGALTDNLQRIGLRAFGGLGINLGIFEEGIREAQESATALAESFVGVGTVLEQEDFEKEIKKYGGSITEAINKNKDLRDSIIAAADAQVMNSKRAEEFIEAQQKQKEIQAELDEKVAEVIEKRERGILKEGIANQAVTELQIKYNEKLEKQLQIQGEIAGEVAEQGTKMTGLSKKTAVLGKLLPGFGKAFKEAMGDPTALMAIGVSLISKAFRELNSETVDFQRYTGQALSNIDRSWRRGALMVNQFKILNALSRDFGMNMSGVVTDEQLAGASVLMTRMGLTAEAAGTLAFLSSQNNTTVENTLDTVIDQVNAFNRVNKAAISHRQVIDDIASASSSTTASLGQQPGRLAAAAASARRLGMEMRQIEGIADNLLNFESSIENELQAQLLTGKNINLAKARELALNNDIAGLGDEIFDNTVGVEEFSRMNRIQQEGLAQALGMSRDELGRIALLRAAEGSLAQEALIRAQGMTREEFERQKAMESIQVSIQRIAETFAPLLDMAARFLDSAIGSRIALATLSTIVTGKLAVGLGKSVLQGVSLVEQFKLLVGQEKILGGLATKRLVINAKALAAEKGISKAIALRTLLEKKGLAPVLAKLAAFTIMNPIGAAIGLGVLAATIGSIGYAVTKGMKEAKDGIITPDQGLIVSGPKGSIQLDPQDSVIAGTDLLNNNNKERTPDLLTVKVEKPELTQSVVAPSSVTTTTSNEDNEKLIRKVDELIQAVKTGGDVFMDSERVGRSLAIGTYKSS